MNNETIFVAGRLAILLRYLEKELNGKRAKKVYISELDIQSIKLAFDVLSEDISSDIIAQLLAEGKNNEK